MATWDAVRHCALALPDTDEDCGEKPAWRVHGRSFVWDRPLRRADLAALGAAAPAGPILGVRVADLGEKDAIIAGNAACFTIPHFAGYPAILVQLDDIDESELAELITDAWLARAPKRLAKAFLAGGG